MILLERTRGRVVLAEKVIRACLVLTGHLAPADRRADESASCEVLRRTDKAAGDGGGIVLERRSDERKEDERERERGPHGGQLHAI